MYNFLSLKFKKIVYIVQTWTICFTCIKKKANIFELFTDKGASASLELTYLLLSSLQFVDKFSNTV